MHDSKDNGLSRDFRNFCVALVVAPFRIALVGWVLTILWLWFVVPTFGARPLSMPEALGLSLIIALCTTRNMVYRNQEIDMAQTIIGGFLNPLFTLALAYILKGFM